ncbi:MAG: hypothetical protein IIC96_18900 [Chloroflexi bacterium]|nr:hypothetical protein [Chloroflexota bacterium]
MLTEEGLRKDIEFMRRETNHIAVQVAVGIEDRYMVGSIFCGLIVIESTIELWPGGYVLLGAPVMEPWIACAEMGAE